MPHWARKGSLCIQAPGKCGGVAKRAGSRAEPSQPWGCRGHTVEGGGWQRLARCPVTQGPLPAVLLYRSLARYEALPSCLLFPSPPLGSPGLPWERGKTRDLGLESNRVTISAQWMSSWAALGKSHCLSEPVSLLEMRMAVST